MIAANNGWIVALDNLSGLTPALSDALCTLATGGGFGTRELYTDDEEKLFEATRPILLNGIEDVATRPDLIDRAICLTLPTIPDAQRQDEGALWAEFERARPRVLGALLDAVVVALRDLPSVQLPNKPRMADFAMWVTAAEPALPWKQGTFMTAYVGNRGAANELALEASILGCPIVSLMAVCDLWEGTSRELLDALETKHTSEMIKKHKEWPGGPRKLSGELRRLAPNLRRSGLAVSFDREAGGQRRRLIRLERTRISPSLPSQSTHGTDATTPGTDTQVRGQDPYPGDDAGADNARPDGRDGWDGVLDQDSISPEKLEEEVEWTA
jgi:hypothetical protein